MSAKTETARTSAPMPDVVRIQTRRAALMQERQAALRRRDFAAFNEITRRLAKLPVPVVRAGVVVVDYNA